MGSRKTEPMAAVVHRKKRRRTNPSQFIATSYPAIKEARPDLKVLIREASGIEPRAFARFGKSFVLNFVGSESMGERERR